MSYEIDIDIDWNEEGDTGLPWAFIDSAVVPERHPASGGARS
jgi:hypothetical protein